MKITREDLYPQARDVGESILWKLPLMFGTLEVDAVFLGVATSRQATHSHQGEEIPDDRKCSRCRWFEPRLFRETTGERRYLMYTIGCSDVDGEKDLIRYRYGRDAFDTVAAMKTAHPVTGVRAIVGVTKRMFEQAVVHEPDLRPALELGAPQEEAADGRAWRSS